MLCALRFTALWELRKGSSCVNNGEGSFSSSLPRVSGFYLSQYFKDDSFLPLLGIDE